MEAIQVIFAIIKAIPILDRWFEAVSVFYWEWKYQKNKREADEAMKKAEDEFDTEDLQKEIGEKL